MFTKEELIYAYTRNQAIADGVLIDVSEPAREAGFVFPVAVTAGVWSECIRIPRGATGQDETGRLWDVLMLLRFAIRKATDESRVEFAVHVRNDDAGGTPPLVRLYAVCGPGDQAEPVITVMLPHED